MKKIVLIVWLISATVLANEQIILSEQQLNNLGIKLGTPKAISAIPLLDAPAKVSIPPRHEYFVSTSQSGLVNQINVSIGDVVKKGQVLATLKSPEFLALQRQHLKSLNEWQLAKINFIRDEKLSKQKIIAKRRWLKTKANYRAFKVKLDESRQLLDISGFSQSEIKNLESTHKISNQLSILSPLSGVVLQRMITTGERVDTLAPLFRVANLDKLWLDIKVPQQYIDQVHEGDLVLVNGIDLTAKVFLLGKNVDENNQTILVRAVVTMGKDALRPGQIVNVKISQTTEFIKFKVPNSSLAQLKGKSYLFIRNKQGFNTKPVQILGRENQQSIISGEIQENTEIAISGAASLKANLLGLGRDE